MKRELYIPFFHKHLKTALWHNFIKPSFTFIMLIIKYIYIYDLDFMFQQIKQKLHFCVEFTDWLLLTVFNVTESAEMLKLPIMLEWIEWMHSDVILLLRNDPRSTITIMCQLWNSYRFDFMILLYGEERNCISLSSTL